MQPGQLTIIGREAISYELMTSDKFAALKPLVDLRPGRDPSLPPLFVFRWGNQGSISISSAAVEQPHLSGWIPLLQCEFDLHYSPLMELRPGKGRIILCLLGIEDQVSGDSVAASLLDNLL